MIADNSVGKGTSGMYKVGSIIDGMNMNLLSLFVNALRFKAQLLKKAPA